MRAPALSFLLIGLLAGCSKPQVELAVHQADGQPVFDFATHHINGLLTFCLWRSDSKEIIWEVSLNYFKEPHLVYGNVPKNFAAFNGSPQNAEQEFPRAGEKPKPLPQNCRMYVQIVYQYDTSMAASASYSYFALVTDSNGHVASVAPISLSPDDLPQKH